MDNLELMKQIDNNSIDLIYIDPPFSTGRIFKTKKGEKAYEDDYTLEELVEFLTPRIREMHRTLKATGTFYLHGDYRFIPYMKIECDKIFGIDNFRSEIIWNYGTPSGGRSKQSNLVNTHDTILMYSKNIKESIYNIKYTPYSEKYINDWFKYEDNEGRHRKRWKGRDDEGNPIYQKQYLKESKGVPLSTVWTDIRQIYANPQAYKNKSEITGYPTQKPKELLDRILKIAMPYNEENDTYSGVVADFFAGSGTTLEAAKELGVNYIGCDNSDVAIKYIKNRLLDVVDNND